MEGESGGTGESTQKAPTFSEADLQKAVAKATQETSANLLAEIKNKFGGADPDAAATLYNEAMARRQQEMSDLERSQTELKTLQDERLVEKSATEEALRTAKKLVRDAKLTIELGRAGANPDRVAGLIRISELESSEDSDVKKEADSLKNSYPELFGTPTPGHSGVPAGGIPRTKGDIDDPVSRATERAKQYNEKAAKMAGRKA